MSEGSTPAAESPERDPIEPDVPSARGLSLDALRNLGLAIRVVHLLQASNVRTAGELAQYSASELRAAVKRDNPRCSFGLFELAELRRVLERIGLSLRPDGPR